MRQEKRITITDAGRDKDKEFVIKELSSFAAEQWVWRLVPMLAHAGFPIDDKTLKAGFAGIAAMGTAAVLTMPYELVKPLLDEMLTCISYQHYDDAGRAQPLQPIRMNDNCQIEEVATWFQLRKAVLDLHINPFLAAAESKGSAKRHRSAA